MSVLALAKKPSLRILIVALCLCLFASTTLPAASSTTHQPNYAMSINWNKVAYWTFVGLIAGGTVLLGAAAIATCPASTPFIIKTAIVVGTTMIAGGTVGWGYLGRPN